MQVEVITGGDDFSFERDRFLWRAWIHENVTTVGFNVFAHATNAELAIVVFDHAEHATLFLLTKPIYITASHIKNTYEWKLGDYGTLLAQIN